MRTYVLLLVMLAACSGSDDDDTADDDSAADSDDDSGDDEVLDGPLVISGVVASVSSVGRRVAGVEVCLYGRATRCATTDAEGAFTLTGVPQHTDVLVSFARDEYSPQVAPLHLAADLEGWLYRLVPSGLVMTSYGRVGESADAGKGVVFFRVSDLGDGGIGTGAEPPADVAVTMEPESGSGPWYFGADSFPDQTLAGTSSDNGGGLLLDVDPGVIDVLFEHSTKSCTYDVLGWPSAARTLGARVVAGYVTSIAALCVD